MAIKDDTGDAFIREVDDEYRRDKLGRAWNRYGRWAIVGVAALLIAVAALLYWRNWRASQADARAALFSQALGEVRAGQMAKASPTLSSLATAPEPGYRALARLEQAGTVAASDPVKAASLYDAAAADGDLAQPFRDLALLKATQLEFDKLPPATIVARLRPMALPGNPWFGTAGELTALAQLRAGHADLARPLLDGIVKDESVPVSIRGRVQQLLAGLSPAPAAIAPTGAPAR